MSFYILGIAIHIADVELLERDFDIEMTQDDVAEMRTISDVIRIVSKNLI